MSTITFNAGRVLFMPPDTTLAPLATKGKITVTSAPEGLIIFTWEPREPTDGEPMGETDRLFLVPEVAEWLPVLECESGRVYVLKFNSSTERVFFWLQYPTSGSDPGYHSETDRQIARQINELLHSTTPLVFDREAGSRSGPGGDGDHAESSGATEDNANAGDRTGDASGGADAAEGANGDEMDVDTAPENQQSGDSDQNVMAELLYKSMPIMSITDMYSVDHILAYIDSASEEELAPLLGMLPDGLEKTREELSEMIRSPHFRENLDFMSQVLIQGARNRVGMLYSRQFGYPYVQEGVEGLLKGIRRIVYPL
ncbi:hypothetical protein CANCADRAFT_43199 [Tortispora caseinolytica NRRL Y-17796]|uniref:Pru domain-containing protein n=1 Tax=Tortispora caseinolytica NRRL Y-17796 TaxID=767744 RepID=A0A1E4TLI8_9ASCO|nr:hypothetical protein CANCADRAFT_43199 [Tortispora caseinolytica NRRL Y-17796]